MRHKSIAISGGYLLARIERDGDTPWRDVLRWNCKELDKLEALEDPTEAEERRMEELEAHCRAEVCGQWWVVKWPQHVLTPRYTSDAIYFPGTEAEAKREADLVHC